MSARKVTRAEIIDAIVRRAIPRVIDMCRYTDIDIVFANGQRRGGVRSVIRKAWRQELPHWAIREDKATA